jgi:seryl-tRNA synthetase
VRPRRKGDEAEFERLRALVAEKKAESRRAGGRGQGADARLTDLLMGLPNLPHDDVPDGADEDDNVEIHRWGTPRAFDFPPKEHFEIAGVGRGMDFETAAKLSGARFVVLSGAMARLHRALAQFMLDTHVDENGLTETWTPVLVREEAMYGTGQLPKFGEDSYQTTEWLVADPHRRGDADQHRRGPDGRWSYLPRRYVAHTQCFRSEAGSAGKDTAGMLRQHQFEKVEMVSRHPPR